MKEVIPSSRVRGCKKRTSRLIASKKEINLNKEAFKSFDVFEETSSILRKIRCESNYKGTIMDATRFIFDEDGYHGI